MRPAFGLAIPREYLEIVSPWFFMTASFGALEIEEISADTFPDGFWLSKENAETDHRDQESQSNRSSQMFPMLPFGAKVVPVA